MSKRSGDQTVTQKQDVDPWVMGQFKNNYNDVTRLAGQPYQPYTGDRVAGFGGDWMRGADMMRDAATKHGGMIDEASGMVRDIAGRPAPKFSDYNMQDYMNPFIGNVVDSSMGDLNRARMIAGQSDAARASGMGAFGGSRHGIVEAETNRGFADAAARTSADLRARGFDAASGLITGDMNRDMFGRSIGLQGAGLLSDLADQGYSGAEKMLGLGATEQAQKQAELDAQYGSFMDKQNHPYSMLNFRNQSLAGFPGGGTYTTSQPTYSNPGAGFLGGAATGAGIGKALGLAGPWGYAAAGLGGLLGLF